MSRARWQGPHALQHFEADLFTAGCQPDPGSGRARCPGHGGRGKNLSYRAGSRGGVALKCFSHGCSRDAIFAGLEKRLQAGPPGKKGVATPSVSSSTVQYCSRGLTVTEYADAKRLPEAFLRETFGLEDDSYNREPRVKLPYFDAAGHPGRVRYRWALAKAEGRDGRFTWRTNDKADLALYGLHLRDRWPPEAPVLLVEGESDVQTLAHAGFPAAGVPGASSWRDEWAAELEGRRIVAIQEPDAGGATFAAKLLASPLRDRLAFASLAPHKDPSELWLAEPKRKPFRRAMERAIKAATPAVEVIERERDQRREAAWRECRSLARHRDLLRTFIRDLEALGVVGERRAACLVFLALVSRLLPRPVSTVLKGPSSAGKSWTAENVLRFFPDSAFYRLSGMSERFLVYDPEPLAHRIVYIAEAAGLEGDIASYLVRTLLSENRLVWGTVDKLFGGTLAGRRIEKEGPTGVLITTTRVRLHPENETRLLSIPVSDTREQTRHVLRTRANGHAPEPDLSRWHALATWLEAGERRVKIPFAPALAEAIPPVAVRLRRDFGTLLVLIQAHALLHSAKRDRDSEGSIVATLDDYAAVRALVADLMAEGVERSVRPIVRETVEAVRRLLGRKTADPLALPWVSGGELAEALEIDKAAVSRRVATAARLEYLVNAEDRRGRPARYTLGPVPLPEEEEILPPVELLTPKRGGSKPPGSRRRSRRPRRAHTAVEADGAKAV